MDMLTEPKDRMVEVPGCDRCRGEQLVRPDPARPASASGSRCGKACQTPQTANGSAAMAIAACRSRPWRNQHVESAAHLAGGAVRAHGGDVDGREGWDAGGLIKGDLVMVVQ